MKRSPPFVIALRRSAAVALFWGLTAGAQDVQFEATEPSTSKVQSQSGEKRTSVDTPPGTWPIDPRSPVHPAGALFRGWHPRPARWFLSARADVGFLFFRPRAAVGYGRPHQHWAGLDVVPILSTNQAGVYSGLRYRHPRFEVRTGGLFSHAFNRSYLDAKDAFDRRELEIRGDDIAAYGASDSELTLSIPLRSVLIGAETQVLYVFGVPDDKFVFVNTVGAVVAPPWAFRQLLFVGHPVPRLPGLFLAPAFEVVFVPGRTDPWVIRAGGVARFSMYQEVDLSTELLPTIKSPDTLGRAGAPWFQITLRVRWATN